MLCRVRINESDWLEPKLRRSEQLLHDELSGVTCTGNENSLAGVVLSAPHVALTTDADHETGEGDERSRQESVDEDNRERNAGRRQASQGQENQTYDGADQSADYAGRDYRPQLTHARMPPEATIHPGGVKDSKPEGDGQDEVRSDELYVFSEPLEMLEPHQECDERRNDDRQNVGDEQVPISE
jgi:hypothetical protein